MLVGFILSATKIGVFFCINAMITPKIGTRKRLRERGSARSHQFMDEKNRQMEITSRALKQARSIYGAMFFTLVSYHSSIRLSTLSLVACHEII